MNWKDELTRIDDKLYVLTESIICELDVPRREHLQKQAELAIRCRSFVKQKVLETWVWAGRRLKPRKGSK